MSPPIERLLIGNVDFEHALCGGGGRRPGTLRRIVAELAPGWIAAAREGDVLWCPEPIGPAFFERLEERGLPPIRPVTRSVDVPRGLELVPWGWTDEVKRWGRSVGAIANAAPLEAVRNVNSRRFSHGLERDWGVGLPGSAAAETLTGLFETIERLPDPDAGWVVKAEFSNSSRERFLHRGYDRPGRGGRVRSEAHGPTSPRVATGGLAQWAERRLARGHVLFVEPWVERVAEIGVQLTVTAGGEPRVEGLTGLLVDDAGRYRGSEFTPVLDDDPHWQDAVAIALDVAKAAGQTGYFGPLGIDAMRYRDAAGNLHLRPIQDINARWTMGRLSLGLRRLLRPGECGYWLHGPGTVVAGEALATPAPRIREIVTSPATIGGRPARLRSVIRIVDPS